MLHLGGSSRWSKPVGVVSSLALPHVIAAQVWKYHAACAHLRVCMEIAASAANEKRRFALAVFYDELCRKEWAERASRGDFDFDVNIVSMVKDLEILARARIAYDGASKQQLCLHLL